MAKKTILFECQACGYQTGKWLGKCPQCGDFDSFLELKQSQIEDLKKIAKAVKSKEEAICIEDVQIEDIKRYDTGDSELNLVLGGGLVVGSLVLIGGSPGVGKSTLLLKIASNLAKQGKKVLYVSAEESKAQIKLRANRLEANSKKLFLLTKLCFEDILAELEGYDALVIDSIQTIYSENVSSAAGSISQVREITFALMKIAKERDISTFIIGHITKDGAIAGPRVLEHMVDVVLYFEGDSNKELRILRSFKNRFGSIAEVGIFQMSSKGLLSANDAASHFFSRASSQAGSAITIIMQGSRPLVLEVQALVCESAYPKRSASGFDKNRLDMLLALLEKKLEIGLSHYDVFINVSGGVRLTDTAADLCVVAAIISSFKNRPLSKDSIFLGELSLSGELREVISLDTRLKEAVTHKFKSAIVPSKPLEKVPIKVYAMKSIQSVLEWF